MAHHSIAETITGSRSVTGTIHVSHGSKLCQEKNMNKITPMQPEPDLLTSESGLLLELLAHVTHVNYQHIDQVSSLG